MSQLHLDFLLDAPVLQDRRPATGELVLPERSAMTPGGLDVTFLHRGFCIAGLPHRRPKDPSAAWSRHDERFALTVQPTELTLPGGNRVRIGVPYGPKARLLTMWLATEARDPARRPGDLWVEIGRIAPWLRTLGIDISYGQRGSVLATKQQLIHLAFSQFTMVMKDAVEASFKREALIEGGVVAERDLAALADGRIADVAFPAGVQLTTTASQRFRQHAIPLPTARLRQVAHNSMAIDILAFLAYRLPMIGIGDSELVSWRSLIAQFGSNEAPSKFRETFLDSIRATLAAYPEARVDLTDEGLQLWYSDPAELRKAYFVVGWDGHPSALKPKRRKRGASALVPGALSPDAAADRPAGPIIVTDEEAADEQLIST